jgi:hypothetical protein
MRDPFASAARAAAFALFSILSIGDIFTRSTETQL